MSRRSLPAAGGRPTERRPTERLAFANQLRGVAALSVVFVHLVGVFWLMRDVVSRATSTPLLDAPIPPMVRLVLHPWFNFGAFGVALFFLISGLVIPISLEKHRPAGFLLARALRIYPTYAAALGIGVAVTYANALLWGQPFRPGAWTILSNLLLVHDFVGQPSLDLVNWTLCVELRFYLVVALCAAAVRRGSVAALFAIALAAFGTSLFAASGAAGPVAPDPVLIAYTLGTEAQFIVFMLIGVLFNYHLRGLIGTAGLLAATAAMGGIFAACWRTGILAHQFPGVPANYALALAVFAALYALRRWVPRNPVLDGLAAVSFPLYALHPLVGYSALRPLLAWGLPYPAALGAVLLLLLALSALLHVLVERPTIRMGRALAEGGPSTSHQRPVGGTSERLRLT